MTLYSKLEKKEFRTDNFSTRRRNGVVKFFIIFERPAEGNQPSKAYVFAGTYLRGSNLAIYQGDILKQRNDIQPGVELQVMKKEAKKYGQVIATLE